jgi:DNA processing protein
MPKNKLKYSIALTHFPKFGPARLKRLKRYFSDPEEAFKGGLRELMQAGIEESVAGEFISARGQIEPGQIIEKLDKEEIDVLSIENVAYPKLLKKIYDPPQLLYSKGKLEAKDEFSLAVVGTRKYSAYGQQVTEEVTRDLAHAQLTIVSGLALGIDALAHNAALNAGGRTIAVLGSGLDKENIYPTSNRYLADKIIASGGAIISEFPIGTRPLRHHFPQRNRIIAGLSLGTLVIEAGEKSGALITARHALDQNREVFAIPGNIYSPVSYGPNDLIKQGARVVTGAGDIIETLDLAQVTTHIQSQEIIPETAEEEMILGHLSHESLHVDELVRLTELNAAAVNATLTVMEMKGMVKNLGNMQYVLAR